MLNRTFREGTTLLSCVSTVKGGMNQVLIAQRLFNQAKPDSFRRPVEACFATAFAIRSSIRKSCKSTPYSPWIQMPQTTGQQLVVPSSFTEEVIIPSVFQLFFDLRRS